VKCPHCGSSKSSIEETRQRDGGRKVVRVRLCKSVSCGRKFTTVEEVGAYGWHRLVAKS